MSQKSSSVKVDTSFQRFLTWSENIRAKSIVPKNVVRGWLSPLKSFSEVMEDDELKDLNKALENLRNQGEDGLSETARRWLHRNVDLGKSPKTARTYQGKTIRALEMFLDTVNGGNKLHNTTFRTVSTPRKKKVATKEKVATQVTPALTESELVFGSSSGIEIRVPDGIEMSSELIGQVSAQWAMSCLPFDEAVRFSNAIHQHVNGAPAGS